MSETPNNAASQTGIYQYRPSHVLPAVFAALVGLSLLVHICQNFRFRFWRITFFMFWGGAVFTTGWILRCISSYHPSNSNLYMAQIVFIFAGPPIYSAAEYNILGRLMFYLPMYAPLSPGRVVYFFIYIGAAVESLTAAGASNMASTPHTLAAFRRGGILLSVALVLQGVVEILFMAMVATIHYRCTRDGMVPRNVRKLCVMLYGTSTLVLLRCIFRAIESFSTYVTTCRGGGLCHVIIHQEWYLYVFEAAPMLLYTYWINFMHPGTLLPRQRTRYLDIDGKTERLGPGWIDKRSKWQTFADPLDVVGNVGGQPNHEKFWLQPDDWPVADDGSFASGTASNVKGPQNDIWSRATRKHANES